MVSLVEYFLLFIIYAILGWIIEIIVKYREFNRFINRGFLIGPYCPIYGCGGLLITLTLTRYYDQPITLFVMAVFICGILEYLTSYIMEKLFKARWWDYSSNKFNINGRVCLETLFPFGVLGCLVVYIFNPILFNLFNLMGSTLSLVLASILLIVFIIDLCISFKIITNFKKNAMVLVAKDNTEEISKRVKETLEAASRLLNNRLVNAFPNVRKTIDEITKRLIDELEQSNSKSKINKVLNKIKSVLKGLN